MKILHIIAQLPAQTGSGIYYQNLIQGMANKSTENALIYASQQPFKIDLPADYYYPVEFLSSNLNFPMPGMSDVMPYPSTLYSEMTDSQLNKWQKAFKQQLLKAKQEFKPDIVICHHLWYLTSMALDIFTEVPVIGISHGTDIRQAIRHPHLKEKFVSRINRLSLVFSLSHFDKERIIETFKVDTDKIYITGNGFNPDLFNFNGGKNHSSNSVKIVYAGKITASKGIFELAQTFPTLKKTCPHLEMHLIGNGEENQKEKLYQLAGHRENKGFHLHSSMPQKSLAEFLKSADIFVLPSYYEGLATIALEAMACGLRAVVTELLPLKKLLGDNVNQSGVVEYVPLPRLINQDEPLEQDIPLFINNLINKLSLQIGRVIKKEEIPLQVYQDINKLSWPRIIEQQYNLMLKVITDYNKD